MSVIRLPRWGSLFIGLCYLAQMRVKLIYHIAKSRQKITTLEWERSNAGEDGDDDKKHFRFVYFASISPERLVCD